MITGSDFTHFLRDVNAAKADFQKAMAEYTAGDLPLHEAGMSVAGVYGTIFTGCPVVFHPAEVFMTFGPGRELKEATKKFGGEVNRDALNQYALRSSQLVVDSVNKNPTVTRLIYTSSILAMMDASVESWHNSA